MSDGRLVKRVFSKHFMIFLLWQSRAQHCHKTTYTKSGISFIRMASVHVKFIKESTKTPIYAVFLEDIDASNFSP